MKEKKKMVEWEEVKGREKEKEGGEGRGKRAKRQKDGLSTLIFWINASEKKKRIFFLFFLLPR